jgi:hypothetical protein
MKKMRGKSQEIFLLSLTFDNGLMKEIYSPNENHFLLEIL